MISRQIFHWNQVLLELWLCWRDFTKHFVGQRAKWRMSFAKCQSWVLMFVHCIGISVLDLEKKHLLIFTLLPAPHPGSWVRWRSPCCPCSPSSAASPLPSSSGFPCFLTKSKFYLFHQVWLICFLTNTKSSSFVFPKKQFDSPIECERDLLLFGRWRSSMASSRMNSLKKNCSSIQGAMN